MESVSLTALADEHLAMARAASSGRSSVTLHGGHEHPLRQTLIALAAGRELDEHESPGEATLQVLTGRVRLLAGDEQQQAATGDYVVIPRTRHALAADADSVVLLTVLAH